jgi:hypothetical protein
MSTPFPLSLPPYPHPPSPPAPLWYGDRPPLLTTSLERQPARPSPPSLIMMRTSWLGVTLRTPMWRISPSSGPAMTNRAMLPWMLTTFPTPTFPAHLTGTPTTSYVTCLLPRPTDPSSFPPIITLGLLLQTTLPGIPTPVDNDVVHGGDISEWTVDITYRHRRHA